ncbi:GDYXXLXY domain-containing protein [Roseibium marinum]|uniref:Putative membrane-anchored protein n=1 Tax=Roseibium marinum TaxID=281252 RepID=A0A2S3UX53_9HYPH|nr:GDYXXLXY domain-containing protein [Roseibium marinum]POF32254.1 putative membrane-anchored protein [Roseibium marinum]
MTQSADAIPSAMSARVRAPFLIWGLLALIQLALISIPLVDRLQVQMTGEAVQLEIVPVDPRDLLRGDYVVINLAIANVSKDIPGSDTLRSGDVVFVGLSAEGGGPAGPVILAKAREEAGPLAISGTVLSVSDDSLRIDYGIDAFFLPEGEGRIIERLDRKRVLLEVSIAGDGRSLPLALLVDGKTFRSDSIF